MGAAESGFESVASLAESLRAVEERLLRVEELTFQHRAPSSADRCVLVNSIQVQTDPDLLISTGPVLGKVTLDSIMLLTELQTAGRATRSARLSFNIFKVDALTMRSTFVRTDYTTAVTNEPCVHSITELESDSHYAVFIGGIEAKQVFDRFLFFQTLPHDPQLLRLGCVHNARTDLSVPDELELMEKLRSLTPRYRADCQLRNENEPRPLHAILFIGGSLSLGTVFDKQAPRLLKSLFDCAVDDSIWIDALSEFKAAVSRQYQLCYQEEAFGLVCRRCSCYFFGDVEEKLTDRICGLVDHNTYIEGELAGIKQEFNDLTVCVAKLITKTLRQVNMAYYRALWDAQSSAYTALNQVEIEELSAEIQLRRAHICRQRECLRATALLEARVQRSGPTASSTVEIESYLTQVSALRDTSRDELSKFLLSTPPPEITDELERASFQSPNIALNERVTPMRRIAAAVPYSNHAIIEVGKSLLVFVDSSWESSKDLVHYGSINSALDSALQPYFYDESVALIKNRSEIKVVVVATVRGYYSSTIDSAQLLKSALLTRLAKWRQSGEDRSVFLVVPASCDAFHSSYTGLLGPVHGSDSQSSVMEFPNWEQGKCEIKCVCVGHFKGNRRAQSSVGYVVNDDSQLSTEGEDLFQFIPEPSDISNSNSFCTVDVAEGSSRFDDGFDRTVVDVITGPTVGWCSSHSAAILLEVNALNSRQNCLNIEVHVVDNVSSSKIACFKWIACLRPSILIVEKILPGRRYDVYLNTWQETGNSTSMHKRSSFKTPWRSLKTQTRIEVDSSSDEPQFEEFLHQPFGDSKSFNILFCGAIVNKSSAQYIDAPWPMYVAQQNLLQYKTNEMLTNPFTSIDLVVHCGLASCLDSFREGIITALARAERETSKTKVHLSDAEDAYRDAMRLFWASNVTSTCRHMLLSSPVLDLLKVFNCCSLEEIRRDSLSEYCVRELIRIAGKVHSEYMRSLWSPHSAIVDTGGQEDYQLFEDRILVYPLRLQSDNGVRRPIDSHLNTVVDEHLSFLSQALRSQSDVQQLVLLSGIPIIMGDVVKENLEDDLPSSPRLSLYYVKALFRIISQWLFETPFRNCTVVAESEESANICKIKIQYVEEIREMEQLCICGLSKIPPIWSSGGHSFPHDPCYFNAGEFSISYRYEEWRGAAADITPCVLYLHFEMSDGNSECQYAFHTVDSIEKLSYHEESLSQSLWLDKLRTIVTGNAFTQIQKGDENKNYNNSVDTISISFAVRELFETYQGILKALHLKFARGQFGIPRGSTVDTCFFNISKEFYNRIPPKVNVALNIPSSLVVNWVWTHFIGQTAGGIAVSSEKEEFAYSILSRHENNFSQLIRQMFESMLLLNYLSFKQGYT